MRHLLPSWAWPLNFFQIHGTLCCYDMLTEFQKKGFLDFNLCYEARTLYEANVLIIWGSISNALSDLITNQLGTMTRIKYIVHMKGGDCLGDKNTSSSLASVLPISAAISKCLLKKTDYQKLTCEARQCLRA